MKKILLIIITAFLLIGCMDNKASDAVKNYLNQGKIFPIIPKKKNK